MAEEFEVRGPHEDQMDWSMSTILTARRQLSWPVETGDKSDCLMIE